MSGTTSPADAGPSVDDFTLSVPMAGPPNVVFEALTTTDGVSKWWAPATGSAEEGGTLTFHFDGRVCTMHVDRAARPSLVVWTAVPPQVFDDWIGTTVTFTISPDGAGSRVDFVHTGLAALDCIDVCRPGWTHYLGSLAAHVAAAQGHPYYPGKVRPA